MQIIHEQAGVRLLRWPKILLDTKMDSDGLGFKPYSTPLRLQGRLWNFRNAKQSGVETACGLFLASGRASWM
jgi:hypothetical protein